MYGILNNMRRVSLISLTYSRLSRITIAIYLVVFGRKIKISKAHCTNHAKPSPMTHPVYVNVNKTDRKRRIARKTFLNIKSHTANIVVANSRFECDNTGLACGQKGGCTTCVCSCLSSEQLFLWTPLAHYTVMERILITKVAQVSQHDPLLCARSLDRIRDDAGPPINNQFINCSTQRGWHMRYFWAGLAIQPPGGQT